LFKNVASQKLTVFAFDSVTGLPKTGDAANLTAYVSKDDGTVTALGDTSATETDSTNAKGMYVFDLTQGETNGDKLVFSGKSSTTGIVVVPQTIYTVPANFTKATFDSNGRPEVNATHFAGTAFASVVFPSTRSWWVSKSGNDSNTGTYASPLLTIGAAVTVAADGDTIFIGDGTYTETIDGTGKALSYVGTGRQLVTVTTSASTPTIRFTHNCRFKGLTLINTNSGGTALHSLSGKHNVKVEGCSLQAPFDCMFSQASVNMRVIDTEMLGNYDGFNLAGSRNLLVDNCYLFTDNTYNVGAVDVDFRGGICGEAVIRNSHFKSARTDTRAAKTIALFAGDNCTIENTILEATVTNASGVSESLGLLAQHTSGNNGFVVLNKITFKQSNTGAGGIKNSRATDCSVIEIGTNIDMSKVVGTHTRSGIDWAKISNPTTTNGLTGTTISTSQVAASVTAGVTVTTNNDKTGYRLSAAGIDDVWDEALSGHATSGTSGKTLSDANTHAFDAYDQAAQASSFAESAASDAANASDQIGDVSNGFTNLINAVDNVTGNVAGVQGTVDDITNSVVTVQNSIDTLSDDLPGIVHDNAPMPPSALTIAAAVASNEDIAAGLDTISTNLDAKVSELEGGGGTVIPVNQVAVPLSRTWNLKVGGNSLVGEVPLVRPLGENQTFAISFAVDLAANGRLVSLDSISQISGPLGGLVFSNVDSDQGVDRGEAKFKVHLVSAGTYQIGCNVTYSDADGGGTSEGVVTLIVKS